MWTVPLICLALCGLAEEPDLAALVDRLNSAAATPAERDEAAAALESAGVSALPALRASRAGTDPEHARRIAALIEEIGRHRLLRPTRVALDLDDQPLADAVAALQRASGFEIALVPEGDARGRDRRVTLHEPNGLGFWDAFDRISAAGGVRLDIPPPQVQGRGPAIRLVAHEGPPPPSAHAGPYRAVVTSLHRHREVALAQVPADSKVKEDFQVALQVVAEPGLVIERNGPPRLLEAIDDQDRDLLGPPIGESINPGMMTVRRWDSNTLGSLTYTIPLKLPEPRGTRIKRLRGFVPITAMSRTGPVLVVPLKDAEGKTFSAGGVTVTGQRAKAAAGRQSSLQLLIQGASEPAAAVPSFASGPNQRTLGPIRLRLQPNDQFQFVDAQGHPHQRGNISRGITTEGKGGLIFTILSGGAGANDPPTELRYFDISAVATEVPFDFADLPLP